MQGKRFAYHSLAQRLAFDKFGHDRYYDIALELERQATDVFAQKGIYPNVDFYSGLVYKKLNIPVDLYTPVFAIARVPGWLAHWKEQMAECYYQKSLHRLRSKRGYRADLLLWMLERWNASGSGIF